MLIADNNYLRLRLITRRLAQFWAVLQHTGADTQLIIREMFDPEVGDRIENLEGTVRDLDGVILPVAKRKAAHQHVGVPDGLYLTRHQCFLRRRKALFDLIALRKHINDIQ